MPVRIFFPLARSCTKWSPAAGHLKADQNLDAFAILHKEPQPRRLAPNVPAELEKIISRCLRKDPNAAHSTWSISSWRWRNSSRIPRPASYRLGSTASRRPPAALLFVAILSGVAVLLAAAGAFWWLKRTLPPGAHRLGANHEFRGFRRQPALSPDGRMLTFIRGPDFHTPGQVYVKLLPSGEPVQLTHETHENEPGLFAGWIAHRLYG